MIWSEHLSIVIVRNLQDYLTTGFTVASFYANGSVSQEQQATGIVVYFILNINTINNNNNNL